MSHKYATLGQLGSVLVVKYGGNAMPADGPDPVLREVAELWRAGTRVVLVHGGGPEIDRAVDARGIATERIDGLRVTCAATLDVTEAVLCGTVNKRIVRALAALGVSAAGISGEDGGTLAAECERAELGYVGRIAHVDPKLVRTLLAAGFLPVVAPLAIALDARHAYNVNADLSAGALAGALGADAFVALTNVERIYRDVADPASAIDSMSLDEARAFVATDACASSMKPKVRAAIEAVSTGAKIAYVCGAAPGAIGAAIAGNATTIAA